MTRRNIQPFGFRIRQDVKEAAKAEAERNRRSLNTELEMLVEEGLAWRKLKDQSAA
ncbi:hypothetical protein D9M71_737640 [compost metagenome]